MKSYVDTVKILLALAALGGVVYYFTVADQQQVHEHVERAVDQIQALGPAHDPVFGPGSTEELPPRRKLPLPDNGMSFYPNGNKGFNPLVVINQSATQHSIVKFEDAYTGALISKHFVHAKQKVRITLPDGVYRVKWANGKVWYGDPYLFGPATEVYQMPEQFTVNPNTTYVTESVTINILTFYGEDHGVSGAKW